MVELINLTERYTLKQYLKHANNIGFIKDGEDKTFFLVEMDVFHGNKIGYKEKALIVYRGANLDVENDLIEGKTEKTFKFRRNTVWGKFRVLRRYSILSNHIVQVVDCEKHQVYQCLLSELRVPTVYNVYREG